MYYTLIREMRKMMGIGENLEMCLKCIKFRHFIQKFRESAAVYTFIFRTFTLLLKCIPLRFLNSTSTEVSAAAAAALTLEHTRELRAQ